MEIVTENDNNLLPPPLLLTNPFSRWFLMAKSSLYEWILYDFTELENEIILFTLDSFYYSIVQHTCKKFPITFFSFRRDVPLSRTEQTTINLFQILIYLLTTDFSRPVSLVQLTELDFRMQAAIYSACGS